MTKANFRRAVGRALARGLKTVDQIVDDMMCRYFPVAHAREIYDGYHDLRYALTNALRRELPEIRAEYERRKGS